jgi:hypothetical protein
MTIRNVATNIASKTENPQESKAPKIHWDTSNLKSCYANVCNVSSTREEVIFNFGVNQAWERGQKEMQIELNNRLILSPFAAKRLSLMLNKLLVEYETHYGALNLEVSSQANDSTPAEIKQKQ